MKKILISLFILSLFISGCAHTISKYSNEKSNEFYRRVEKICEKQEYLIIETVDGNKYKASELKITEDTTSFIENGSNLIIVKNTHEISAVSFFQTSRGAIDGLIYGTLVGGGVGIVGQLNAGGGSAPKGDIYFLLYSTLTGAAVGITYGLINPGKITIKFN